MLWKSLGHYGIPAKIVRMIKVLYMYDGFQASVLHEGRMAEPAFEMKNWVRQGCLLSPVLFLVTLIDWVIVRQAYGENETGIQFTAFKKLEDLKFVEDLVLLSQSITHARQKFQSGDRGHEVWEQIKRTPQNRVRWRKLVEALFSGRSEDN